MRLPAPCSIFGKGGGGEIVYLSPDGAEVDWGTRTALATHWAQIITLATELDKIVVGCGHASLLAIPHERHSILFKEIGKMTGRAGRA